MGRRSRTFAVVSLLFAISHAQRPDPNGNTCPESCPDSVRPVCGTNNVAYRNECHLRRASCQNSQIQKRNDGPCVSSESRDCQQSCPNSYQPMCASNGRTYGNRCLLNVASCENPSIRVRFEGVCDIPANNAQHNSANSVPSQTSGNRPSVGDLMLGTPARPNVPSGTQSSPAASAPVINVPQPERNCPDDCAPGFRPVCGTDGQVYGNDCKLRVAICKSPNLQKKNDGVCEKDCNIDCPVEVSYVCGSDGRTYVNECELIVARCKDPAVSKIRDGACPNFRETDCAIQYCENALAPVCGSDGRTYENVCQLRNRACVDRGLLRLHDGRCVVQRCGETCPSILEPVCGSDGVDYPNLCTLINIACKAGSNLVKQGDGPCRP